jgi:hypothetical protein
MNQDRECKLLALLVLSSKKVLSDSNGSNDSTVSSRNDKTPKPTHKHPPQQHTQKKANQQTARFDTQKPGRIE